MFPDIGIHHNSMRCSCSLDHKGKGGAEEQNNNRMVRPHHCFCSRCRRIFRDLRYTTIWVASAIATFPLLVPPFFLPLYGQSLGLSTFSSAALVAGFNMSSAIGRISFGQLSDVIGPVNALILAMVINGIGMLLIWPLSSQLAPLIVFVILGGMSMGKS